MRQAKRGTLLVVLMGYLVVGCAPTEVGEDGGKQSQDGTQSPTFTKYHGFGYANDYETFAFVDFEYSGDNLKNFNLNGNPTSLDAFRVLGDSYLSKLQSNEGVFYIAKSSEGHGFLLSNWQFWSFDTISSNGVGFSIADLDGNWTGVGHFFGSSASEDPLSSGVEVTCASSVCSIARITSDEVDVIEVMHLDSFYSNYGLYMLEGGQSSDSIGNFIVTAKKDRMSFEINCYYGFQNLPCIAGWLYKE